MPRHGGYPTELRERAVWVVLDDEHEYGSRWEAITLVAEKLGSTPGRVGNWVGLLRDGARWPVEEVILLIDAHKDQCCGTL